MTEGRHLTCWHGSSRRQEALVGGQVQLCVTQSMTPSCPKNGCVLIVVLLSLAKPRIQPAPPLLKALVGQTVTLPCVVQGEPSPEVNWFHNGLPVGIKDTSPFRIQHVSMADKGTYQCVARNSAGQETLEIMLEILGEFLFLNTSLLQLK
uniref:Ig-like domain-containing protein n=1 Tax=Hippocampus comes TaxID=109280 RepID=A0A3Q2XQS5_HIPCM